MCLGSNLQQRPKHGWRYLRKTKKSPQQVTDLDLCCRWNIICFLYMTAWKGCLRIMATFISRSSSCYLSSCSVLEKSMESRQQAAKVPKKTKKKIKRRRM